jgi:WbqC-like protein family
MLLSGHQPVYLPGIILFNKIVLSDSFMFVGHVQYSNRSWQTRNRIRLNGAEHFLSVPVQKNFGQSIRDTLLAAEPWPRKHLGSIRQAYLKRPFFQTYFPRLSDILEQPHANLDELNRALIMQFLTWLEIETPILDSRDLAVDGAKTDMLISMCRCAGADAYLSNEGARDYVDEPHMAAQGFAHHWQLFEHPQYDQGAKDFVPHLSIIDLLFNLGPAARDVVRGCGTVSEAWK